METIYKMLVINPGSTSTKVSYFENEKNIYTESVFHDAPVLLSYPTVNDQIPLRRAFLEDFMNRHGLKLSEIDAFVGRGGSAWSQPSGVMEIDGRLVADTAAGVGGSDHPAKLGVMIAWELGREFGGKMYTVNPTNVDELCDCARPTGIAGVYRRAQTHVLNQKGIAAIHAKAMGKHYEDCNFIVSHIDGGITVTAHCKGRMIDSTEGAGGDGPFTPTRLGSIPVMEVLTYLEAGHTTAEVKKMLSRSGGFVSHFGTSNSDTIHAMVASGDRKATVIWNTMTYQICKSIGAMAAVLEGKVDGILLTGGLMRFGDIVEGIRQRCGWIAPITVYPGECEQEAMAESVLEVLRGQKQAHRYTGEPVFQGFGWENET
ncbi:MAG: butyrate kinase [Faecousia sp.]